MFNMNRHGRLFFCLCIFLWSRTSQADDHLLYFEAQEIFGYSSALDKTIPYSSSRNSVMQKPSLGFDYLQRFSGDSGDFAVFALQYRLALTQIARTSSGASASASVQGPQEPIVICHKTEDQAPAYKSGSDAPEFEHDGYKTEHQVYNAYLKVKTPWSSVWLGHNGPAFGLSSYLDSHGHLLSTLGMRFGYDRDWGIGTSKDLEWGDISASITTGSGMPFYTGRRGIPFNSHSMAASRISYGVLSRDNFSTGFSLASGRTLNTVGYTLVDREPRRMQLAGTDVTLLRDNLEHRIELYHGEWLGNSLNAVSYRLGINLDDEGRYKIEAQPVYSKFAGEKDSQGSLCFSVRATSNLTVRTEYLYDSLLNENRFLLQLYLYHPI